MILTAVEKAPCVLRVRSSHLGHLSCASSLAHASIPARRARRAPARTLERARTASNDASLGSFRERIRDGINDRASPYTRRSTQMCRRTEAGHHVRLGTSLFSRSQTKGRRRTADPRRIWTNERLGPGATRETSRASRTIALGMTMMAQRRQGRGNRMEGAWTAPRGRSVRSRSRRRC